MEENRFFKSGSGFRLIMQSPKNCFLPCSFFPLSLLFLSPCYTDFSHFAYEAEIFGTSGVRRTFASDSHEENISP